METWPPIGGPLLEEVAEGIFAYLANQRQMAQSPNQFEAQRSGPVGIDDNIPRGRWNLVGFLRPTLVRMV